MNLLILETLCEILLKISASVWSLFSMSIPHIRCNEKIISQAAFFRSFQNHNSQVAFCMHLQYI